MKTKRKARLSKKPSGDDYIVEIINGGVSVLKYFSARADARAHAKFVLSHRDERVRVFRVRYELVSDSHKKARK